MRGTSRLLHAFINYIHPVPPRVWTIEIRRDFAKKKKCDSTEDVLSTIELKREKEKKISKGEKYRGRKIECGCSITGALSCRWNFFFGNPAGWKRFLEKESSRFVFRGQTAKRYFTVSSERPSSFFFSGKKFGAEVGSFALVWRI